MAYTGGSYPNVRIFHHQPVIVEFVRRDQLAQIGPAFVVDANVNIELHRVEKCSGLVIQSVGPVGINLCLRPLAQAL